jgi:putative ATP-binding cassette transporter
LPETGEIRFNGRPVTDENREYYRQRFSMVFFDFYLFESLFGLEAPKLDEQAREYLTLLQLDHKVEIKDGVLSTTDLSQGQRKRLALLTAYLEDRPIYVFDEWAADQDPLFKEIFYYRLLPDLKAKGKTIMVISHDDRYYNVADRIIKLECGRIDSDESMTSAHYAVAQPACI